MLKQVQYDKKIGSINSTLAVTVPIADLVQSLRHLTCREIKDEYPW